MEVQVLTFSVLAQEGVSDNFHVPMALLLRNELLVPINPYRTNVENRVSS